MLILSSTGQDPCTTTDHSHMIWCAVPAAARASARSCSWRTRCTCFLLDRTAKAASYGSQSLDLGEWLAGSRLLYAVLCDLLSCVT